MTLSGLLAALRNPKAAWHLLARAKADYGKLGSAVGVTRGKFKAYMIEIARDRAFGERIWNEVEAFDASVRRRGIPGGAGAMPQDLCRVVYAMVRSVRPAIVLETGVASGLSSCYILRALHDNRHGTLFSVDQPCSLSSASFPATPIPDGAMRGWLIPSELKERWNLILGPSSEVLPKLLEATGPIDVFLHDSDHTYENQRYEYQLAWVHLREGGLLLSDDIGRAFLEFSEQASGRLFRYGRFGVIAKRTAWRPSPPGSTSQPRSVA